MTAIDFKLSDQISSPLLAKKRKGPTGDEAENVRLSGSAKDFVGSAFRAAPESFAICHPIIRDKDL
jgi:hypothetical protein